MILFSAELLPPCIARKASGGAVMSYIEYMKAIIYDTTSRLSELFDELYGGVEGEDIVPL